MKITLDNGQEIELAKDTTIEQTAKKITEALKEEKREFPIGGDGYWYIGSNGSTFPKTWDNNFVDNYRLKHGNVFRTFEESERWLKIDNAIHNIVWEKNKETPIDWNDEDQKKYCLDYNKKRKDSLLVDHDYIWKRQGTLYCSSDFLPDLLEIVTEDDLKWYVTRKV